MKYSILYPDGREPEIKTMSEVTFHDLGLDTVCKSVGRNESEYDYIRRTMCAINSDPETAEYRAGIFADIYGFPTLRERILKLLDKVNFIKEYGIRRDYDEKAGIWDLMHRLDEVNDYINCIEDMQECLGDYDLKSEGLINLREHINRIYHEEGFDALKKDIDKLNATASTIKSVTVGINLNERFEAESIGVVSVNDKPFTKAGLIGNFYERMVGGDNLKEGTDWDNDYKYHPFTPRDVSEMGGFERMVGAKMMSNISTMATGMSYIAKNDIAGDITSYMDKIVSHLLHNAVNTLKNLLGNHLSISIRDITGLIPEFVYYVRWAEYIDKAVKRGLRFCRPFALKERREERRMHAGGLYNLKLSQSDACAPNSIVFNDLCFDNEHRVYILTGANRGGKTTISQAVGQLFVLAQGGIYVPASVFEYHPVDNIFTHFPADEDKTLDLGRLGEECRRFKESFVQSTADSLLLLNETFSTTSFEEGYYIAYDSVRAILKRGIRTVYNTHMHKLAYSIDELNASAAEDGKPSPDKASSLVVEVRDGVCSYRVKIAPPEGMSYAKAIAEKYGVTYDELMQEQQS